MLIGIDVNNRAISLLPSSAVARQAAYGSYRPFDPVARTEVRPTCVKDAGRTFGCPRLLHHVSQFDRAMAQE